MLMDSTAAPVWLGPRPHFLTTTARAAREWRSGVRSICVFGRGDKRREPELGRFPATSPFPIVQIFLVKLLTVAGSPNSLRALRHSSHSPPPPARAFIQARSAILFLGQSVLKLTARRAQISAPLSNSQTTSRSLIRVDPRNPRLKICAPSACICGLKSWFRLRRVGRRRQSLSLSKWALPPDPDLAEPRFRLIP